jgi:hypothetical protein
VQKIKLIQFVLCGGACALWLSACHPLFECTKNIHCSQGFRCEEMRCKSVTSPDPNQERQTDASPDTPPTEKQDCTTDPTLCGTGQECVEGECVEVRVSSCRSNQDCKTTEACLFIRPQAQTGGVCMSKCSQDQDCGLGLRCLGGVCSFRCEQDTHCSNGGKCISGECKQSVGLSCHSNADCGEGQRCGKGGICSSI